MDKQFEAGVLAAMLKQPRLLRAYRGTLAEHHFSYTPLRYVAKLALEASDANEAPSVAELGYLIDKAASSQNWGAETLSAVLDAAAMVWGATATNTTNDYIKQFIIQSEFRQISESMSTSTPEEQIKKLAEYQRRLNALSADHASDALTLGRNMFGDGPEGFEKTIELIGSNYDPSLCLPLGWRLFDQVMLGGIRPKELNIIMGPTNTGKSELLIQLIRIFNAIGKRVVLYGIDSTDEEMSERNVTAQTGVGIDASVEISLRQKMMREKATKHNLFIYREWSPHKQRVADIITHLQVIRDELGPIDQKEGRLNPGEVDVVLIDSPQLLTTAGKRSTEAKRFDHQEIYYDVTALAKDEKKIVIATHQANREAMKAVSLGLEHIGEALAVVQPATTVIGLPNRTVAERAAKTRRLQFLKLRKPDGVGKQIRCIVDARKQLMWEDPDQEELEDMYDEQTGTGGTSHKTTRKKPEPALDPNAGGEAPRPPKRVFVSPDRLESKDDGNGGSTVIDWSTFTTAPKPARKPIPRGIGNPGG